MSYEKQNFVDNQVLTAEQLNHIEDGIENLNGRIIEVTESFVRPEDFGAVGDGVTDDTISLQEALEQAYLTEKPLLIPQGEYVITDTISCSPMVHIIPVGNVTIIDKGEDNKISINMQSKDNEILSNDHYFCNPNISNTLGNITILNNDINNVKTGLFITGVSIEGNQKRNNVLLKGITVKKYNRGVQLDSQSTYMITMERCIFTSCDYGLFFGNDENKVVDTGESFLFYDCLWGNCKTAIKNLNNRLEASFNNCKIDMCGCGVLAGSALKMTFDNCHFESIGVGSNYIENNEGFEGIIKTDDSDNYYDKSNISLNDCSIVMLGPSGNPTVDENRYPSTKLFTGSKMILNLKNILFDCDELYWFYNTILDNDIDKMFCVDDNIKELNVCNIYSAYNQNPYLKMNDNVLQNAYFNNDELKSFNITDKTITDVELSDFVISNSQGLKSADIVLDDVINKKCLKIQCVENTVACFIEMESKQKFPIIGDRFDAVMMLKGYKYYKWSSMGMNSWCQIFLDWYDIDNTLISESRVYNSYRVYRGDDEYEQYNVENADKWMICHTNYSDFVHAPKNAFYYKIKVVMYTNRGDEIYTPVYFTGIHVFNN